MSKLSKSDLTTIQRLLDSESEDFSTLVNLAGLDPVTDFRFADLAGIDFGGADLRDYDFTGANLEGADLSRAIVNSKLPQQAKLKEAFLPPPATRRHVRVCILYVRADIYELDIIREAPKLIKAGFADCGVDVILTSALLSEFYDTSSLVAELRKSDIVVLFEHAGSIYDSISTRNLTTTGNYIARSGKTKMSIKAYTSTEYIPTDRNWMFTVRTDWIVEVVCQRPTVRLNSRLAQLQVR